MRKFYTYVPSNIDKQMTLVVGLHGYTGNAKTFIRKGDADFNNFLEINNFIGAYPEGKSFYANGRKFSSWNDLAGSIGQGPKGDICDIDRDYYPYPPDCVNPHRCSWASCGDDIGFVEKVIDYHKNQYDIKSVIVIGMSNGGMLAQAIGCNLTDKVDAIINIEGMQALGMSCIPKKPLTMVIYGAKNDTTVPPQDILASDGYFYEPMKNTVNDWKNAFNCSNSTKKQTSNPAEISEEHFYDCDGGVTITSIMDHNNDHDWPKPYKWGINLLFAPILN
jgi:poly(3-hydroxybutyrate) depolymerase